MALLLGAGLAGGAAGGAAPVVLTDSTRTINLVPHLEILRDPGGALEMAEVCAEEEAGRFRPSGGQYFFGFTDDAIWVRTAVRAETTRSRTWFFELAHARFEEVDWHVVRAGRPAEHFADGNRGPRDPAAVNSRFPARALELAPGETVELYLRVRTPMVAETPLAVYSSTEYVAYTVGYALFHMFGLGGLAMLLATGVIYAVFTKDRGYWAYAAAIGFVTLYFLGLTGYWRQLEWPGWRFGQARGTLLFNGLGLLALLQYTRWFFDLKETLPGADRWVRRLQWAGGAILLGMPFAPFRTGLAAVQLLDAAGSTAILVSAGLAWRRGQRTARFYLLAWLAFWGLLGVELLQLWQVIPPVAAPGNLPLAGVLLGFGLFQAAMADRVRRLREDKEAAQAQAEQIAREAAVREESERRLRRVLDKIPTAVRVTFTAPDAPEALFMNERFIQLFGYRVDEIRSLDEWFERAYPDRAVRAEVRGWWEAAIQGSAREGIASHACRITRSDGAVVETMVFVTTVGDMVLTTFVDVTERQRMENELRETKEKLEATLAALPDLLFRIDREGRIREFHSAPENPTFVPAAEFLGRRFSEVLPEAAAGVLAGALAEAAATGHHHGATYSLPVAGDDRWYEASIEALGGAGGDCIVLVRDITQRRQAEEALRARRAELEEAQRLAHVGSWTHELAADKIEWSDEVFRIFGQEPGRPPASFEELGGLMDADSFARVEAGVERCAATGAPYKEALTLRRPDGEIRHVIARGERVPGEPVRLRGTVTDITDMVRIQEELRARQAELERAKEAAEEANRAKGLFLANMSHEIRTPLSALVGLAQVMVRRAENQNLPADFRRLLERIRSGGSYLGVMLTNLLDLSAGETGRMRVRCETVDLAAWSHSLQDLLEPLAEAKGVELRWRDETLAGPEVQTDPVRLAQVVINLVHNAIKYTPAGRGVDVRFERGPGRLALTVEDEGPGLPPGRAVRFEAYGEDTAQVAGPEHGAGLGLYVARINTEALGGRISADNRPDGGARFRAEWPPGEEGEEDESSDH
ncbi:MAG TPA: 7TM diverse intracellular signaling domain-containing protein [Kiritimatiellia bacterium]|nr:7TM diverse intracellular signaling domain-containing protein [Kiritimatiellia bacterium]